MITMMNKMVTNLKQYKNIKRAKAITNDLELILNIINNNIKLLNPYKKYIPVKDVLGNLQENYKLIDLYYKKYKEIANKQELIKNE